MTVWVLHQSLTAQEETLIEQRAELLLPFGDMPDLSPIANQKECRRMVQALMPDAPPETVSLKADRVWKLYSELQPEDLVVVPLPSLQELALAKVSGHYRYAVGFGGSDRHVTPVSWYRRIPMRTMRKYADSFAVGSGQMREITDAQARIALREKLPHSYNRFVRWKWLLGVFFGLSMLRLLQQMLQPH